ncbi:hypothetical protein ACFY3O_30860 [Streptomyces sp. NPDC001046]|uniref:hypothetical protein n=1 Tax=Streptomyces sp. NPDC001046 TaxID=3364543 RepID=UPI0036BB64DD
MNKKPAAALATVAALSVSALTATPAYAYSTRYCSTTGAYGAVYIYNWTDPGAKVKLTFYLTDTLADGHHVRIRLVSKQYDGTRKNWPWRKNFDGKGDTKTWDTTADDDRGLHEIGVQVARFEGDQLLNSCTDLP